jgi:hypothetical protein
MSFRSSAPVLEWNGSGWQRCRPGVSSTYERGGKGGKKGRGWRGEGDGGGTGVGGGRGTGVEWAVVARSFGFNGPD